MKTIKTGPHTSRHEAHSTADTDLEGERLEAARTEFQAAWEAKVARREQRRELARKLIAACHTVTLKVGILWVIGVWAVQSALTLLPVPQFVVQGLMFVMFGAFVLFWVLLGCVSLWAYVAGRLEEREVRHL